jgi:dihydroorotase
MTSELFQQIRILDPVTHCDRTTDVLVVDGTIAAVADTISESDLPADTQIQQGVGLVLGTGLIDLYSHSGEPGFESRETLASLMAAAIAGGFTRLALLPDTDPPVDSPAGVTWIRSHQKKLDRTPILYIWGALTLGTKGEQMAELAELAAAEVVGFTDGLPMQNGALLRRILEYGQPLGKPIALWCCDRGITGNGAVRDGVAALQLGIEGSPAIAETAPLAALLEFIIELKTPIHIMRVSTARSVELIRAAKAQGLPITASTTWMHLLLDVLDVQSYDPSLRLDPPLGNPDDRQALIQGIQDGTIDAIAVDHSPYTYEEKTVPFAEAPPGAIGLELALPLLWQTFVATGEWEALTLWRSLSSHPAYCLGQPPATLVPGQPAELTLFAPQTEWQVSSQTLCSLARNTPWLGKTLKGKVVRTSMG